MMTWRQPETETRSAAEEEECAREGNFFAAEQQRVPRLRCHNATGVADGLKGGSNVLVRPRTSSMVTHNGVEDNEADKASEGTQMHHVARQPPHVRVR